MIRVWGMRITNFKHLFVVLLVTTMYVYYLAYRFEISQGSSVKPYPGFLSQDTSSLDSYTGVRKASNESCPIPDVNPFDPRAVKFLSYRPRIDCGILQPTLTYIDLRFLILNTSAVTKAGWRQEDIKCMYAEIDRIVGRDDDIQYGPQQKLIGKAEVHAPVVQVHCEKKGSWGNVYENVHYVLHNVQRPLYRLNKADIGGSYKSTSNNNSETFKNLYQNSTEAPSILILAIDGLSRLNAVRLMPQTMKYLKNQLDAYIFLKHAKCGVNSFPNLAALMTGRRSFQWNGPGFSRDPELPHCREKTCDLDYIDEWPFIWKEFENRGYHTALGEDKPYIGIFNFLMKGFLHPPTHHYFRPLWISKAFLESSGSIASKSKEHCFINAPEYQQILNQAMDIQKTYHSQPHFSYFHTSVAHADMNLFQVLDAPVKKFLSELKEGGLLDNTFLILMGDHGFRFGEFRKTWLGRLDDNLPLFSVVLPEKIRQRHPHLHKALQSNVETLTSWYDVHSTLMDIAKSNYGAKATYGDLHGRSLFRKVPDRSCEETEIPLAFCPCLREAKVNITDNEVKKAAHILVDTMNQRLQKFSSSCSTLKLSYTQEASSLFIEKMEVGLRLVVSVEPSGGLFETTLTYDNHKKSYMVTEEVQRLDEYKDQGSCINDKEYRPFCHCV